MDCDQPNFAMKHVGYGGLGVFNALGETNWQRL